MKIQQFQKLIQEIPYKNQAFDIKGDNWKTKNQTTLINSIFNNTKIITISRSDLLNDQNDLKKLIIKILMWGYPTKGRGNNIENLLEEEKLNSLATDIGEIKNHNISLQEFQKISEKYDGLGISTLSKFTYFLNTSIEGNKSVILDLKIINTINSNRFEELKPLQKLRYDSAIKKYKDYLHLINTIAKEICVEPDQLEMFLFTFGSNLA